MTGQVKEEVLTRFGELGLRVADGGVRIEPGLLRAREFVREARKFRYLTVDGDWQEIDVPVAGLAFTWCQVPLVYQLDDAAEASLAITSKDGDTQTLSQLFLSPDTAAELFQRSGNIRQLTVTLRADMLFAE